ncbi:MAG: tRNA (adenosine(37)-N6)-threonylcarbamoyltransferase complex dimerization subunit type 1 TsaB [Planctomycetaceae bacterium]|nr:tRNA (adenosine(37)-N6)-threonylcarbamoyltransferase complex dimerization subunit type 1 TsaB [Planctomycetaceae bacterium]
MLASLMNILGLETSGLTGSIALDRDGAVEQRELATAGRRHAQTLVAEMRELLHAHGLRPADVNALAVSIGPGSFTGLRVGVVCAKTFAYATGCRVIAVDTLAAVAQQAPPEFTRLWIISDAQRGDFFTAHYTRTDELWQRDDDVRVVHGPTWLPMLTADDIIAGPATSRIVPDSTLAHIIRDDWATRPTAAGIIAIARPRLMAGQQDDLWTLTPLYIRPSAAEEKLSPTRSVSEGARLVPSPGASLGEG